MSTAPQPQPQAQPMMKIVCSQCAKELFVRAPIFRVANFQDYSSLTFVHTKLDKCGECGAVYLCLFTERGINPENGAIELNFIRVEQPAAPVIIPDANGLEEAKKAHKLAQELNKVKLN